jgi:hypothetical protein
LLAQARGAGLHVANDEGILRVRGPRSLGPLARQLLARKGDVLDELALETVRQVFRRIEVVAVESLAPPGGDTWPAGTTGAAANSGGFWD